MKNNYEKNGKSVELTTLSQISVVKLGGALLNSYAQNQFMAEQLALLSKNGLYPTVVHGGGPQIEDELVKKSIEAPKINGIRQTSIAASYVVAKVANSIGYGLTNAIHETGTAATHFKPNSGVILGTVTDEDNLDSVNSIFINSEPLQEATEAGSIPILSSVGGLIHNASNFRPININADVAATEIAFDLKAKKYISVTGVGGVLNTKDQLIDSLTTEEAIAMIASHDIGPDMAVKVEQALRLAEHGADNVIITGPQYLVPYLMNSSGKGTIIKSIR